jgi:membrane fusion protein, copper/silver efflux system
MIQSHRAYSYGSTILMLVTLAGSPAHGQHAHEGRSPSPPPQQDAPRAELTIPTVQQRRMGLQVTTAVLAPQNLDLRTVGVATVDDAREVRLHTQLSGWVREIHAARTGDPVSKGEVLFRIYSPDVLATQQEYLSARRAGEVGAEIAAAALRRLRLWGLDPRDIQHLQKTGEVRETVGVASPIDGLILERNIAQASYITPSLELYRIVDLSVVWILITLYEQDLPLIEAGDAVSLRFPGRADVLEGRIDYVYPEIDPETRTATARVTMPNPELRIRPGMYLDVFLRKRLKEAISIPENAIIRTGLRDLVFVRHGDVHFMPRNVRIGRRDGEMRAIHEGLQAGEVVVLRPLFLIDSESRLEAAIEAGTPGAPEHVH